MVKQTILVDTRERRPLRFTLPTTKRKLETGDYSLAGFSGAMTVELKRYSDYTSCLSTSARWKKFTKFQLTRLATFEYALLLIIGYLGKDTNRWSSCKPSTIINRTSFILAKFKIPIVFVPNDKVAGEVIEEYLLACSKEILVK